jgi:class 3 adenylate cyclase/tetratricopeptide (TPR) repeat protein
MICERCGTENPDVAKFCMACAAPLAEKAEAEERKLVSVLFVDLVGFTARSDQADPEDVRATLRPYHARVKEEIERFGGTVEKFVGDGVMAVFGAPVGHGDDAERAVRAALRVTEAIQDLNRVHPELDLAVRAAVNTGEAMVSVGARLHEGESMVAGDVVNTASRLQQEAPVGGVVVGETTYRATRQSVDFEPLEPVALKGKAEPVALWVAKSVRGEFRGDVEPSGTTPLIGREGELGHLRRLWEQTAADRRPHLVMLIGPPGIGKSRLLWEFTKSVDGTGRVLTGRCRPYGETTGYGAFGQQLQQAAGIFATDSASIAEDRLYSRVAELLPAEDAPEVAGHLGVLLGLPGRESPDKQILFYSARRFVEALAKERPLVLATEDIHWADPALLELLESLAGRTREVPLLMVTLARPELLDARPTWGGGLTSYTAIPVEPLSDEEARDLALLHLSSSDVAAEAVNRLALAAGGNPLFLEELAASLAEGTAEVAEGLPTNVQAIIAARLDSLPADERRVLQDASVVGGVFWRGALAAFSADRERLDLLLDSLESRDFIRVQPTSRVAGDREYLFKHVLTREVAYSTLPRASRRERHRMVAEFLEMAIGDRIGEQASLLAHHFREAGDLGKAAAFLLTAAEVASRAWAKQEAVQMYSDAIALFEQLGDEEAATRALIARGSTRVDAGDLTGAVEDVDPVLTRVAGHDLAAALLARTQAAYWLTDAESVHRYAEQAVEVAREIGDRELEAHALAILAEALGMDGETSQALETFAQARSKWPSTEQDRSFAQLMAQGAIIHYWRGEYERAIEVAKQGFEAGMATSSVFATLAAGSHVAVALCGLSRHEEALEWFRRTVQLGRELEQIPRLTSRGMNMWAGTLRELGDLAGARELSEQALELGRKAGFVGAEVSARIDLLFADIAEGKVGKGEKALPELFDAAERTKGWHQWLWMGRLEQARADLAVGAGRWEEAAEAAETALRRAGDSGRLKYRCLARTTRGRAMLGLGRPKEAEEDFREAASDGDRLRHAPSLWPALAGLSEALAAAGREAEAGEARLRAREALSGFAAGLSEEHRRSLGSTAQVAELLSA